MDFFAKFVHIRFATSWTAKQHFWKKEITSLAPPWGAWWRTHYWGIEREEKSLAPGWNRSHDLESFVLQAGPLPQFDFIELNFDQLYFRSVENVSLSLQNCFVHFLFLLRKSRMYSDDISGTFWAGEILTGTCFIGNYFPSKWYCRIFIEM